MKKLLLTISMLVASSLALAQSSVQIYGIMDVGVLATTNGGNLNGTNLIAPGGVTAGAQSTGTGGSNVRNGTAIGGLSGGESQSRLGFKGSEDLGGGTKAIFLLEQGFNASTGNLANNGLAGNNNLNANAAGDTALQGQLFNRGAYAGLSDNKYGTVTLGRQQNLMLDNIPGYDPVNAQMFSPLAYAGSFGGGGATDESRINSAVKYVWKDGSGFNTNALYGTGGIAGNNSAGTTTGFQLGYEQNKYGVQAIVSHTTDATGLAVPANNASIPNSVAATLQNITAEQITGRYEVTDKIGLKAGYERMFIGTPSNFQLYSNMPTTVSGYSISSWTANPYNYSKNAVWFGGNYQLTPTVKLSAGYYYVGVPQYGKTASGTQQYTSFMVEDYLSKRTNLYAAVMNANTTGGQTSTTATGSSGVVSNQQIYGVGMRHTF
jgi:predicted porin